MNEAELPPCWWAESVEQFHKKASERSKTFEDVTERCGRETRRLLYEEAEELITSPSRENDIRELLDIVYVSLGGLLRMGLTPKQIDDAFGTLVDANWAKVENGAIVVNGKVQKPEGWAPPSFEGL